MNSSEIMKGKTTTKDMIFEQDFAQPHSTNANQEFMEKNFPNHTPTLWRYQDKHELFFGAKWDDFWYIERKWAIYSQRVYRNPRPTNIVRLCHELPPKMNEIYQQKGKRIPSNFDPSKSPFACKCDICSK